MSSPDPNVLATAILHLRAAAYLQIAGFVILVYDHLLTFSDEVERIWKKKITGATILFFLNRYLTPLQMIVIITAFQDPKWKMKACARFVKFEGASSAALIAVCELTMILRVYALYNRSTLVILFLLSLLAVQISTSGAGVHTGFAVPFPAGVTGGCILSGTDSLLGALWVTPLVTDSCIFILTIWKTRQYIMKSGVPPTLRIFIRDGAMYFFVIFGSNLLNTLIYFLAPTDLKALGAPFNQLLTSVMVSRLILNLRSLSESNSTRPNALPGAYIQQEDNAFLRMAIGNLGEDFQHSTVSS